MKELSLYCLVFNYKYIHHFKLFHSLINACNCAMHASIYYITIIEMELYNITVCATLAQCICNIHVWVSDIDKLSSLALQIPEYVFVIST